MSQKRHRKWLKVILPPVILIGAICLMVMMVALKPEQERREPVPVFPKIEVYEVDSGNQAIVVESQGTVQPRRQTQLTARVSGQIEWVSPTFYNGGVFEEGDVLVRLDPLPYRSAVAEAKSRLALARSAWLQEKEAAQQALRDWEAVGTGTPGPLVLREPQIAKAEADLEAARVAVEVAERNLAFTEIRAPYRGRVEAKFVEVGQSITAQVTPLGSVFAADVMEIPLPISLHEAAWLDLPSASAGTDSPGHDTALPDRPVRLHARIADKEHTWEGKLDRISATVDPATRMLQLIIRVDAPYLSNHRMPLKPGMFVNAIATGPRLEGTVRIPRSALHQGDRVYRLIPEDRLEGKRVELLYTGPEWVIASGLETGDRLCMTPLLFFVEGMRVEPVGAWTASAVTDNGSTP